MNKFPVLKKLPLLLPLLAFSFTRTYAQQPATPASAQSENQDPLFQKVASLDATLFHAYNRCDLDKLAALVADDLEFYHDKTGLSVGKPVFIESIKKNICGKVTRELVPGSLEVYPLNTYGAVEIGSHRFHHPGAPDHDVVGEAKFVMLWQNKDGDWKLTRVISYDHAALPK